MLMTMYKDVICEYNDMVRILRCVGTLYTTETKQFKLFCYKLKMLILIPIVSIEN